MDGLLERQIRAGSRNYDSDIIILCEIVSEIEI